MKNTDNQKLEVFLLGLLGGAALGAALIVMFKSLVQVVFGWPLIVLSILVAITGIVLVRPVWVLTGALLAIPFSFYLVATPRFRLVGFLPPLLFLAAAYALQRERRWLALLLIVPYIALAAWLAWTVLS